MTNAGTELLFEMIDRDVKDANDRGTLFRANTISSKAFKFFARMLGLPYLFTTLARPLYDLHKQLKDEEQLQEEIEEVRKAEGSIGAEIFVMTNIEVTFSELRKSSTFHQINPDNMVEGMDESLNILELQIKCQKFLAQITLSYPHLPQ